MDKPVFRWLLIFKDGTHLNTEGDKIDSACENVGRIREDLAVSGAGFLRALPLRRTDNAKEMSQDIKDYLKQLTKNRRSLRNSGRKKSKPQTQARSTPQVPKIKKVTALDKILERD